MKNKLFFAEVGGFHVVVRAPDREAAVRAVKDWRGGDLPPGWTPEELFELDPEGGPAVILNQSC